MTTDTSAAPSTTLQRTAPSVQGTLLRRRLIDVVEAYALVLLTLLVIAFFAVLPSSSESFFTMANLRIQLADQAVLLVVSLAILVPMVSNVWDFAPGASAGLASIYAASVGASSGSVAAAVLVALVVGVVVGVVTSILVTYFKINSVIATFGMTIIIAGIVDQKTGGNSIVSGVPGGFIDFGTGTFLGLPSLAWVAVAVALFVHYLLRLTPYGRSLYAIGSNRPAAKLVGLRVEWLTASTFVIGGALSAVAGVMLLARSGAGNPTVGPGYTIPAYAAVFLGAVAIRPGRWNVGGLVAAICFLGALNSGLTLAGAAPSVNLLANGVALLIGVGFANVFARQRGRELETA